MSAMIYVNRPTELSFPMPKQLDRLMHVHLTVLETCAMLHLTSSTMGEAGSAVASLGSFVYAMPDRLSRRSAISTPIVTSGSSIEFATRLAKILAVKTGRPIYVGCSINLAGTTTEEEMECLSKVVAEATKALSSAT